jgi:hypothetical protein
MIELPWSILTSNRAGHSTIIVINLLPPDRVCQTLYLILVISCQEGWDLPLPQSGPLQSPYLHA